MLISLSYLIQFVYKCTLFCILYRLLVLRFHMTWCNLHFHLNLLRFRYGTQHAICYFCIKYIIATLVFIFFNIYDHFEQISRMLHFFSRLSSIGSFEWLEFQDLPLSLAHWILFCSTNDVLPIILGARHVSREKIFARSVMRVQSNT